MVTMKDLTNFRIDELKSVLSSGHKSEIINFLSKWGLTVKQGKICPSDESKTAWDDVYEYFDKKQLVRKISLNSAFLGAFVW